MQNLKNTQLHWLSLSAIVIIIDQLSKILISHYLILDQTIKILPIFNLTYTLNRGAAFGFLNDAAGWQRWLFVLIAIAISIFILQALYRLSRQENLIACAMALILGGAIGNLYDRVVLGHVRDFISLHWQTWYFAIFNIADSAITVGVILWFAVVLFKKNN
jgi:signal peptidase II